MKAKREKREREPSYGVRRSVLCFSNQMISFNAWIFRKRKGFYGLTDFLWIHADLIWETAAQRTETEGWRIVSLFFLNKCSLPVDMFKFPILGQFLISKRNLEGFNFFPSHVVNKHTGLEDPLFSKYGHEGIETFHARKQWELVCSESLLVVDIISNIYFAKPKLF